MEGDQQLRWYVTVLVVRARVDGVWQGDHLIDHQVRLLRAHDPETAYARALELGSAAEHSYPNGEGALVTWEFAGLADLDEIQAGQPEDGVEVYSWRSRGQPNDAVVPKERLAVFWLAENANRRVDELLD